LLGRCGATPAHRRTLSSCQQTIRGRAGPAFLSDLTHEGGGLAQPFFLILLTRVPCPCLSGFWRDRAGIFVLRRLKCPSLRKERERPGHPSQRSQAVLRGWRSALHSMQLLSPAAAVGHGGAPRRSAHRPGAGARAISLGGYWVGGYADRVENVHLGLRSSLRDLVALLTFPSAEACA